MGQTTLDDWHRDVATDGGRHFDPDAETVSDAWEGAYLYTSWGYNQTNTNFAQITEVSDTGKTVLCRMVTAGRTDIKEGSERLLPTADQYGDEFRLHVRNSGGDPAFRGSYPYIDGEKDSGTRRGSFLPHKEGTVHQTPHTHRH